MNRIRNHVTGSLLAVTLAAVMTADPALAAQPANAAHVSQDLPGRSHVAAPDLTWKKICRKVGTYSGSSTVIIKATPSTGATADDRYREVMRKCHNAQQRFVGDVRTGFTGVSLDQVKQRIDFFYDRYPDIDGIFLDDMGADPDARTEDKSDAPELTAEEYYRSIFAHVRSKNMTQSWVTSTTRLPRTNYTIGGFASGTAAMWPLSVGVVDNLVVVDSATDRSRRRSEPSPVGDDQPTMSNHRVYTVTPGTSEITVRTAQQLGRGPR